MIFGHCVVRFVVVVKHGSYEHVQVATLPFPNFIDFIVFFSWTVKHIQKDNYSA